MSALNSWCDEADSVLADLTKEGSGVDFAVFSLTDVKSKSGPSVVFASPEEDKGQGGRAAVQKSLETAPDDAIRIGCFLVSAIDEVGEGSAISASGSATGPVVSVRMRFVHVVYLGASVGVMLRGKVNSWYAQMRDKLPDAAIKLQLQGDDLDDLQVSALEASLSSSAGGAAQKPKRYSFTNSTAMGRDAAAAARAAEEAKRQAEEEAKRKAEEDARLKTEDAKRRAAEAKVKAAEAERLAKLQAEEEARLKAEEEARLKAEEEARLKAEEEGRLKAEEEARLKAAEEARLKAEEEARLQAEAARIKAEEEARIHAEKEAKRKAAEAEARRLADEERRRHEEAERQRTKILITQNATLGDGRTLILLVSKSSGNPSQNANTSRLKIMLDGLGLPPDEIDEVDGGDVVQKERRNSLFEISGKRAQYPQILMREADGTTNFIGDFDELQFLNESGTLGQTLGVTVKTTKKTVTVTENAGVETVVAETNETIPPPSPQVVEEQVL
jgi:hypothetical protein